MGRPLCLRACRYIFYTLFWMDGWIERDKRDKDKWMDGWLDR